MAALFAALAWAALAWAVLILLPTLRRRRHAAATLMAPSRARGVRPAPTTFTPLRPPTVRLRVAALSG